MEFKYHNKLTFYSFHIRLKSIFFNLIKLNRKKFIQLLKKRNCFISSLRSFKSDILIY